MCTSTILSLSYAHNPSRDVIHMFGEACKTAVCGSIALRRFMHPYPSHVHAAAGFSQDGPAAAPAGMPMSFSFSSYPGPLLFSWWHPQSASAYCASLAAVAAMGMLAEYLAWLSRKGASGNACAPRRDSGEHAAMLHARATDGKQLRRPLLHQCVLHAASIALNLCVMLLAMSFNAGIFVAIVVGSAVGRTALGAPSSSSVTADACH